VRAVNASFSRERHWRAPADLAIDRGRCAKGHWSTLRTKSILEAFYLPSLAVRLPKRRVVQAPLIGYDRPLPSVAD
jgi:hypothetical protein